MEFIEAQLPVFFCPLSLDLNAKILRTRAD